MKYELLKELSEAPGIPGREDRIREIVSREIKSHVDRIDVDAMGNLIAIRKGSLSKAKRVMFAAHMDEIGFYVSYVDERCFARVQAVGGFDTRYLFGRRVNVHTDKGILKGLLNPAGKALHNSTPEDRRSHKEVEDFFIDFGTSTKLKGRVQVGDMVTLDAPFHEIGECVSGKCLDNRVQVFIAVSALKAMKNPKHDIYGVFTVQEEVGLRGALTSSFGVDPHIGIGLDTTVAADVPGNSREQYVTKLGGGVGIKVLDSHLISNKELVDTFSGLAKKLKIPYQLEVLPRGGTDGGAIQRTRSGVKAITLSVPTRYLHTVNETCHKKDVEGAELLLRKYLES